jgi:hypothetical protein
VEPKEIKKAAKEAFPVKKIIATYRSFRFFEDPRQSKKCPTLFTRIAGEFERRQLDDVEKFVRLKP